MRCRAVRLDLRHDSAAIAVRRKAIPLHKGCNFVLSDLLASKLVAREKNELQPRILLVPFSELGVAPIRRASSARNVHNQHRLAREAGEFDRAARERFRR